MIGKTFAVAVAVALVSAGAAVAAAQQWLTVRPNDRLRAPGSIACFAGDDGLACASHGGRLTVALVDDNRRMVALITRDGRTVSKVMLRSER